MAGWDGAEVKLKDVKQWCWENRWNSVEEDKQTKTFSLSICWNLAIWE